jgi:2-polyprenyl-3-methyl-5-hydroxy-6-metoxy-1,4-benzoquinol methylase
MSLAVSQYLEGLRMRAIRPHVVGQILDIGCGYGSVIRTLAPAAEDYVGIDHNPVVTQWLQKQYPAYQFLTRDMDTDPIVLQQKFDTVLMIAVLEHLASPNKLIGSIAEMLKPSGSVVLTTPTPLGGWVHTIGGGLGVFSREAKEDHKGFYDHGSLACLFQDVGLKLVHHHYFMAGMNQLAIFQRVG